MINVTQSHFSEHILLPVYIFYLKVKNFVLNQILQLEIIPTLLLFDFSEYNRRNNMNSAEEK